MNNDEIPKLYRIVAQTESITISAEISSDMTSDKARATANEYIMAPNGKYQPFILLPICTKFQWDNGQINFCPRCGKNICESVGGDCHEAVTEQLKFECPECNANISVHILSTSEQNEIEDDDDQ